MTRGALDLAAMIAARDKREAQAREAELLRLIAVCENPHSIGMLRNLLDRQREKIAKSTRVLNSVTLR